MKTPEQLAEQTVEGFESDDRLTVNEAGDTYSFGYPMLKDMLVAAIEADRAQRNDYVLSFEPGAIRDHFEADEDDPTQGMSDEELLVVAEAALSSDRLYETFHDVLVETLREHS